MNAPRKDYSISALKGYPPQIGRWLWALEDVRRVTKKHLKDLTPEMLDWASPGGGNSIGTLLYHIAAVEIDWLFFEVLECATFPPEVEALFPYDMRNEQGNLTPVQGLTVEEHIHRLDQSRAMLLDSFLNITDQDFYSTRSLPDYDVTPEWVLYHLIEHEAEHRGQIALLRTLIASRDIAR